MLGLAFDVGQTLSASQRLLLRNLANSSGYWSYVEPISLTPRWVHFDERQILAGYPLIRQGSRGVYVCVAQDALTTLGYDTGGLDGVFGTRTQSSVVSYQSRNGLVTDGLVGNLTWNRLMTDVVGRGASDTTILPE